MTRSASDIEFLAKLGESARVVLVLGVFGFAALLASLLSIGDVRFIFAVIAYIGALCVVSFGYIFASYTWPIPKLHWLGLVAPIASGVVYATFLLTGPGKGDMTAVLLQFALWGVRVLIGFVVLGAAAGWFVFWQGKKRGPPTVS